MEVSVLNKQTLIDIAVQLSGNPDFIFELLKLNTELDLDSDLTSGQKIIYETQSNAKKEYLETFNMATGVKSLSEKEWILDTAFWTDQAFWIDNRTWIDEL